MASDHLRTLAAATRTALRLACCALVVAAAAAAAARAAEPEPAVGRHGMVASPQRDATLVGVAVLRAGGNAVDAAVASAFALAVTQPQSMGIGGGAFLLLRRADGSAFALDARETAPAAAQPDTFLAPGLPEGASLFGGLAVATPGFVAGLALALERWGTLGFREVLEPAIRLAEEGYALEPYQAETIERLAASPLAQRFPETARIQFAPLREGGGRLSQPELAATLRTLAREGPGAFYRGPLAEAIAAELARQGGILSVADLAAYTPLVREPVRGRYRGLEVLGFPPPSSAGVALVEALHVLGGFELAALGAGSSASIHRVAEALKLAFADRAAWLGDPAFTPVPVAELTDQAYAARLRARINPPWWRRRPWTWHRREVVLRALGPGLAARDQGTAHLSVVDAAGNAVALTGSINGPYGSWVSVPGTGVLLNNEMDDFATDPEAPNLYGLVGLGRANRVEPGKRPLSSMAPTILVQDGRVRLVAGSNGGPRIISSVLLAVLNVVDWEMDAVEAVSAPRFHHQWQPDTLLLEAAHPRDVVEALARRGHRIERVDELVTGVEAIVCEAGGRCTGASDPRRDGLAAGPSAEALLGGR